MQMHPNLTRIKTVVYDKCQLEISEFKTEPESKEYDACRFKLNGLNAASRSSKITPKKIGQFVTFWKRNGNGPIEPFSHTDRVDFFVVNVQTEDKLGQFVFPKAELIQRGIISTDTKEGKRAFRVYPSWDTVKSRQADRTQKWQLDYFYEIGITIDFKKVNQLYRS